MSDASLIKLTRDLFGRLPQLLSQPTAEDYQSLVEVLKFHERRYYEENDPLISDQDYDKLFNALKQIEATHPDWLIPESPTQRVAPDLGNIGEAVAHMRPMLSLDNSYDLGDLQSWENSILNFLGWSKPNAGLHFCVEPKYDGGSVALLYENDQLIRAATRGNGEVGEDITRNVLEIPGIPRQVPFSKWGLHRVELRGEALLRIDRFKAINAEIERQNHIRREQYEKEHAAWLEAQQNPAEGLFKGLASKREPKLPKPLKLFANPRNAATGSLRVKNARDGHVGQLHCFVYQLAYAVDKDGRDAMGQFQSHFENINLLASLGFETPGDLIRRFERIEEVAEFCKFMQDERERMAYELDGMVVKVDELELQDRLGATAHHPRWAIAYKFAARQGTSTLLKVDFQVGKIGSITPVARIEPVQLAGVTVSNVSLHNEDFIRDKDLLLGDRIIVERAGDVIPYIVASLPEFRDGSQSPIEWPANCPECEQPIIRPEGEARWLCVNHDCPAQVQARLEHHVSKDAMDIEGLGEKQILLFRQQGWLRSIADIYRLPYEKMPGLGNYGNTSIENLRQAIDQARSRPIHRLLFSLSIPQLGQKASKQLAERIADVRDLVGWTTADFTAIHGMGMSLAAEVMGWLSLKHNLELLEELDALGVNLRQTEEDLPKVLNADGPLFGKSILFTGTLQTMGRKEAQERAERAGARIVSGVSAQLDILVVGEKAGSKLDKAKALPQVMILSEEEFVQLVA